MLDYYSDAIIHHEYESSTDKEVHERAEKIEDAHENDKAWFDNIYN